MKRRNPTMEENILEEAREIEAKLKSSGYVNGWYKPTSHVGYIYILVNKLFPNMVKIGYANNLAKRVKDLSGTNLPEPYHCYASYKVTERLEDRVLHMLIDALDPDLRYDKSREFYTMEPERAYKILSAIARISGTEACLEKNPLNDAYFKNCEDEQVKVVDTGSWEGGRRRWTFSKLGIGIGEPLTLNGDDTKVCYVKEDNKIVEYGGQTYSLAELANKLLNCTGCGGPRHFNYKGRVLEDMINDSYFGTAKKECSSNDESSNLANPSPRQTKGSPVSWRVLKNDKGDSIQIGTKFVCSWNQHVGTVVDVDKRLVEIDGKTTTLSGYLFGLAGNRGNYDGSSNFTWDKKPLADLAYEQGLRRVGSVPDPRPMEKQ